MHDETHQMQALVSGGGVPYLRRRRMMLTTGTLVRLLRYSSQGNNSLGIRQPDPRLILLISARLLSGAIMAASTLLARLRSSEQWL